jgi:hypothetical protein
VFVQSTIERVAAKPQLNQQLTTATSDIERAGVYAASGLWYDALAAISGAETANRSDRATTLAKLSLLEQVGLTQVAAQERQSLLSLN